MRRLLLHLLFFSLAAHGQTLDGKIKDNIQNEKTNAHALIPGTRAYLIPPPGFAVFNSGLREIDGTGILVMELIGGNFYTNAATVNKETFESIGKIVLDYKEIHVSGYPGKYMELHGGPMSRAYVLIFGDTTFSISFMAKVSSLEIEKQHQVIASFNSVHYDKNKKVDPFEAAMFSLNDKNSKFKFFQYQAGVYTYTVGGVNNIKGTGNPFIVVSAFPAEGESTPEEFAGLMLSKHGSNVTALKNSSTNAINGYRTYEAEFSGEEGQLRIIYQCIVLENGRVVSIQGHAANNMKTNMKAFREFARTIRMTIPPRVRE